jgi:hypothetical protein
MLSCLKKCVKRLTETKNGRKLLEWSLCETGKLLEMQFLSSKFTVRMAWEKPLMETLIDHLRPRGDVLEVGFALGFAACRIQTYHPRRHTIIEPDPVIAAKAIEWAKNYPSVSVIQESWEHALPRLGVFDSIFLDDIKPELEAEGAQAIEAGNMVVEQGRRLIASIKTQFPEMMSIKYSDVDIDALIAKVGQFQPSDMAKFFRELLQSNQISTQQYERTLSKYGLEKVESTPSKIAAPLTDSVLVFLEACLKNHMRQGSRFCWATASPISKFESPEFFEAIITNPYVDYQEEMISVSVPASCEYYKSKVALIGVVEKHA